MSHTELVILIMGSLIIGASAFRLSLAGALELDYEHWQNARHWCRWGLVLASINFTLIIPSWFWAHRPWLATAIMVLAALGTLIALQLVHMSWLTHREFNVPFWREGKRKH